MQNICTIILCDVVVSSVSGDPPAPPLIPASLSKPVELGGVTYRVVEKRLDWTGALHLCESLNGTLATVKNPYEQAYLTLLINSLRRPAWISLYNYGVSLLYFSTSYYNPLKKKTDNNTDKSNRDEEQQKKNQLIKCFPG